MENGFLLFYKGAAVLSFALLVIAVVFGLLKYSLFNKEQKWYVYYLVFIFIIEFISKLLLIVFKKGNMAVYPFYIGGEFFLLSVMFIEGLRLPRKFFFAVAIISVFIFSEAIALWLFNNNVTSAYGKTISHLIIICMSGYYLIQALKVFEWEKQNKFFNIYGCLFLYYSVSLFLFLLLNKLTPATIYNASIIWGINNVLTSVLYGTSLYTFLTLKRYR